MLALVNHDLQSDLSPLMETNRVDSKAFEAVEEAIVQALGLPPGHRLKAEDSIGTLEGWDSLGHLNILIVLEKRFGKRVAQISELGKATSVGQIVSSLRSQGIV